MREPGLYLGRRAPRVGKVENGKPWQVFAQLMDQIDSGQATDPGVADDKIAHLEAQRELQGRYTVIGVEDGMPLVEEGFDHQPNNCLVLVGNDDVPADEAGGRGLIVVTLGPGDIREWQASGGTATSIYLLVRP